MWENQILVWATDIQKENWGFIGPFLGMVKEQLF